MYAFKNHTLKFYQPQPMLVEQSARRCIELYKSYYSDIEQKDVYTIVALNDSNREISFPAQVKPCGAHIWNEWILDDFLANVTVMNKTYATKVGEITQIPQHIWDQLEILNGIDVPNKSKKYQYYVWTSAWNGNHWLDFSVCRKSDGIFVALYKPLLVPKEVFLAIRDAI